MLDFTLLTVVILAGAGGDASVTRGMKAVGEVTSIRPAFLVRIIGRVATTGWIWLGILCKAIAFAGLLALLARTDLSWVAPATAVSFIVETFAARYLLGEHISQTRWAGAFCVGLGVALISF